MRDLRLLPKAHLHVHLECAVRWSTLREIAEGNGVPLPDGIAEGRLRFEQGFSQFADHGTLVRDCLRQPEDFTRIARELCADEAAQGVGYVELTFTAAAHGERLASLEMPLEAVIRGLREGQAAHGIEWRLILDHSRRRSVERAWRTLDLARAYGAYGVVGMGMAGEESYPLAPFAEVLDAANAHGVHLVHHAGEFGGPDSIREALQVGHAERLGHGIRVLEDPDLVEELRVRGVPLEVCPSSNVALGAVASLASHPLPRLLEAGLVVTLNTDIPATVGTDLTREYTRVRDTFGLDDAALADLAGAGVDASFAPEATKARLRGAINDWLSQPPRPLHAAHRSPAGAAHRPALDRSW
jgi:adenosine deaminase